MKFAHLEPPLPNFNQSCTFRPTLNVTLFASSFDSYSDIPDCFPNSLRTLSIIGSPLLEFQNESRVAKPINWPPRLKLISFRFFEFSSISKRVFEKLPSNVSMSIFLLRCKNAFPNFPSTWPKRNLITTLHIRSCQLDSTNPTDFVFLKNLLTLDLSGNRLTTFPAGLPSSLVTLTLDKNLINVTQPTAFFNVTKLRSLEISHNKLQRVPANLPVNLVRLRLRRNQIKLLDQSIFSHLKKLEILDLSHNGFVA